MKIPNLPFKEGIFLIYFDNSATTKPLPELIDFLCENLKNESDFGNPGSLHSMGLQAEKSISESSDNISQYLSCNSKEIYYTSCGSESINTAIRGYVEANPRAGNEIISTKTEHQASLQTLNYLEKKGYLIKYIGVDKTGKIKLEDLNQAITEKTALITLTHVNNETGAEQDIEEIVEIKNKKNRNTKIHLDCVQSLGKIKLSLSKMKIDMASFSGHKINCLKGSGLLYIKNGIRVSPLILGGGQQRGLRSGTESPYMTKAFSYALSKIEENRDDAFAHVSELKKLLISGLKDYNISVLSPDDALPYIVNISFPGFESETMLHALEEFDIYVSTLSACSSKTKKISYVLSEMGYDRKIASNAIRISFSRFSTKKEVELFLDATKIIYEKYSLD